MPGDGAPPGGSMWDIIGGSLPFVGPMVQAGHEAERRNQDRLAQERQARENRDMQMQFAREGIRWKVQDAKMAGIHPLYALGGNTASYSPVSLPPMESGGSDPMRETREMGQDIIRAKMTSQTAQEKQFDQLRMQGAQLDVEGKAIDNQIRLRQLQQGNGPAFPGSQNFMPGQGNSGLIQEQPMKRVRTREGHPDKEPGAVPGSGFYVTGDGALMPVPSKDTKEAIEDNLFHETAHFLRNNILPNFTGGNPPPGYEWSRYQQGYVRKQGQRPEDPFPKGRPRKHWPRR